MIKPEHFGDNLLLLERIGMGGMGEVFRAKQLGTQGFEKVVAVKRILPTLSNQGDIASLFTKEMRITALLRHSNIAQVFNNGAVGDYLYYVMEYVKGTDACGLNAFSIAAAEPFRLDHAYYIIAEAAKGLHYAHTLCDEETGTPLGIIHRDITPHNIICSEHGEVKILDFGIAKISGHFADKTEPGDIRGSPKYVSPEQMMGDLATPRSDVFALGVILWELLAGRPLFEGETLYTTINNVVHMPIPSIRELRPDVSIEVEEILVDALERDPANRLESAGELHRRLSSCLNTDFPTYRASDLGEFVSQVSSGRGGSRKSSSASNTPRQSSSPRTLGKRKSARLKSYPRLRSALKNGVIVVLGVSIGLGYLKWKHEQEKRILNSYPVIFTATNAEMNSNKRVAAWRASAQTAAFTFEQSEEPRMPLLVPNAIAGHPALRFDGVDDILRSESVANLIAEGTGVTILAVAKLTVNRHGYLFSVSQSDLDSTVFRFGTDDSGKPILKVIEESWLRMLMVGTNHYPSDFAVISAVFSKDKVRLSINGNISLNLRTPNTLPLSKSSLVSIGGTYTQKAPSDFIPVEVAEVQILSRPLDTYSVRMIEENLGHKYGISLPPLGKQG